jgi:hypothetical protein
MAIPRAFSIRMHEIDGRLLVVSKVEDVNPAVAEAWTRAFVGYKKHRHPLKLRVTKISFY